MRAADTREARRGIDHEAPSDTGAPGPEGLKGPSFVLQAGCFCYTSLFSRPTSGAPDRSSLQFRCKKKKPAENHRVGVLLSRIQFSRLRLAIIRTSLQ